MDFRRTITPSALFSMTVVILLLVGGVYWGFNAYLSVNENSIAVAASAAFGSLFVVFAIFVMVSSALVSMNNHLEAIEESNQEQVKLLKYLAKQVQKGEGGI